MKKATDKNITTLDEILENKYGKRGAEKREKWEQECEIQTDTIQALSDYEQYCHVFGQYTIIAQNINA